MYDKDHPTNVCQSKPLTMKNVSPLVLNFTLKAGAPFVLDQTEYQLGFGESATVKVDFDASYKGDKVSHKVKTKLNVTYREHPQKDTMELLADVSYPNVELETDTVDFGCVLNESKRKVYVTITNTSNVDTRYSWFFEDEARPPANLGEHSPRSPLSPSRGGVSPLPTSAANNFDILPIRGFLRPGEKERVEFLYHGHARTKLKASAVCCVDGGPDYVVNMVGEAASIQFKFDKSLLEFGCQGYDRWEEKEIFLINAARVSFPFSVDFGACSPMNRVEVSPKEGILKGNDKVRLAVKFCPRVPDKVEETFLVRVAHFEPQPIKVTGIGQYSSVHINLPRQHMDWFEPFIPIAKENMALSKGRKYWCGPDKKDEVATPMQIDTEAERLYFIRLLEEQRKRQEAEAAAPPPPKPIKPKPKPKGDPKPSLIPPPQSAPPTATPPPRVGSTSTPGPQADHRPSIEMVPLGKDEFDDLIQDPPPAPEGVEVPEPEDPAPPIPTERGQTPQVEALAEVVPEPPQPAEPVFPVEMAKGQNKELKLVVSRYVLDFGPIVKGDTRKKTFRFSNDSHAPLTFQIDKRILANSGVTFSQDRFLKIPGFPNSGHVAVEVTLETKGGKIGVGNFLMEIPVDLKTGPLVILEIRAEVVIPNLQISQDKLDFGVVQVGQTRIIEVQFFNPKPLPCEWSVSLKEEKKKLQVRLFKCFPDSGVLPGGGKANVQLSFVPLEGGLVGQSLLLKMANNPRPTLIQCKGVGDDVNLSIEEPELIMGPVLPYSDADVPFRVVNNGRFAVEFYTCAFDRRHVVEEDILRNSDGFFEDVLLLEPRVPGEALPDVLMEAYYHKLMAEDDAMAAALMPEPEPEDQPARAPSAAPEETPTPVAVSRRPSEHQPRRAAGPVVVLTGASMAGKTVLAEQVHVRYGYPTLDVSKLLSEALAEPQKLASEAEAEPELEPPARAALRQWFQTLPEEGAGFPESALEQLLETRLQEDDLLDGCVVDGLLLADHRRIPPETLAKCLVKACHARSSLHHVMLMIDSALIDLRRAQAIEADAAAKLDATRVAPMPEDEYDALTPAEQAAHQRKLQKLRQCTKTLTMAASARAKVEAARQQLADAGTLQSILAEIEAEEEEERRQQESEASQKGKKGAPADKGKKGKDEAAVVATTEELTPLACYKQSLSKTRQMLAGILETAPAVVEKKGKGEAEAPPAPLLDGRTFEHIVDASQALAEVHEVVYSKLPFERADQPPKPPSVVEDEMAPRPPFVKQKLDRPGPPKAQRRPQYFKVLTPTWVTPEPIVDDAAVAAAKKPPPKKGGKDEPLEEKKAEPVLQLVEETTRWIVQPGQATDLVMRFMSDTISPPIGFPETIYFGVVGTPHRYPIHLNGICQYPEICTDVRVIFPRKVKSRKVDNFVHKHYVLSTKVFEFGPLLAACSSEGYLEGKHPGNSEVFRIVNTGMYEAVVSFCFEDERDPNFLLDPAQMVLQPEETGELRVWAFPTELGELTNSIIVTIKNNPECVRFDLSCYGARPEVEVNGSQGENLIDFDRLLLRTPMTINSVIKNVCALPVAWKLAGTDKLPEEYEIDPIQGVLQPKQEVTVGHTFQATKAADFNTRLDLQVSDIADVKGVAQTIPWQLKAEGFDVYVETTKLVDFGTVKVAIPSMEKIQMLNRGKYDVAFNFKLSKRLNEVFKVNPMSAIIKPKEQVNVELLFSTKKEIILNNNQDMDIRFVEPKTNEEIGAAPMPISVKAFFNTYTLTPAHGINFGPVLFNAKKTSTFEIANQGPFEINFRLFSLREGLPSDGEGLDPNATIGSAAGKDAKKDAKKPPPKKGGKEEKAGDLIIGNFAISPNIGVVPIKGSVTITVTMNPEGNQHFHERLGIDIADRDPADNPQGIPYELEGESCVPSINADLDSPDGESIFEEQQIVSRLDPKKNKLPVYARDERVFSFGTVVADGRRVQERLKLVNPNKVPCTVNVRIKPRGESKDAQTSAEAFDIRGYEVLQIPPHEHRYVNVGFRPQALTTYYAVFEGVVDNSGEAKSKELRFEIRGDGALPQILVELPNPPKGLAPKMEGEVPMKDDGKGGKRPDSKAGAKPGKPAAGAAPPPPAGNKLVFPRTVVGEKAVSWVKVRNASDLPATIRFNFPNTNAFSFPNRNEEIKLQPHQEETYSMYFTPQKSQLYEAKLNLIVPENRFEDTLIMVVGEGFSDLLTFGEVDTDTENVLSLGDCQVNTKKCRSFMLVNHVPQVVRFEWSLPSTEFTVSPLVGHLQPNAMKDISVCFTTEEPKSYEAAPLQVRYQPICYVQPGRKGDWDDRMKRVQWITEEPEPLVKPEVAREPTPVPAAAAAGDEAAKEEDKAAKGKKAGGKDDKKGKKGGKGDKEEEERLQREREEEEARLAEKAKAEEEERLRLEEEEAAAAAVEADAPLVRPRKQLKKVVDIEPEPAYEDAGEAKERELFVRCICGHAKWSVTTEPNVLETGIRFRTTKMYQQRIFTFPLQNVSEVEMRYSWRVQEMDGSEEEDPGTFMIEPSTGTLQPGAAVDIHVRYAPLDINSPHRKMLQGFVENLAENDEQPSIQLLGYSECPLVHFELASSDYLTASRRPPEFQGPGSSLGVIDPSITQVIEFQSRGIRIRNTKRFYVLNPTHMTYEFEWVDETGDSATSSLFHCHTSRGVIHSGKKYEMVFDYIPETLDIKECLYKFNITGKTSVPFLIVGQAVEPDVYFDKPRLNFDSVLLGAKSRQTITIENKEDIPYAFAFDKVMDVNTEGRSMVSLHPMAGTVAAHGHINVEVTFSPTTEESYNYNLVCRVKKKTTFLTCNIKGEGYKVHEDMLMASEHDSLVLQPSIPNRVDFGKVHINDTAVKTVILANTGRYNFDFKWAPSASRFVSINPEIGSVAKGEKCAIELTFLPTNECHLDNIKATCKITNGHQYVLLLNGSGAQPQLHFSFKSYDFGSCFLKTATPYTACLTVSNRDEQDISFDVPWENKEHLEVSAGASVLQKGESKDILITFMPKDIIPYHEVIPFEINSLYTVPFTVTGEGTIPRVELVNPSHKVLNLGALRVGETVKKTVKVVCKSKVPTPLSLAHFDLSKYFISVVPRTQLDLKPKEVRTLEFTFAPTQRLRPFTQDVYVEIAGIPRPLLSVSGAGQGIELHLDTKTVSFGPVVQGTCVMKRILLFNTGDLGVKFQWDQRRLEPDFSVNPAEGFVQAHNDVAIEITFAPTVAGRNSVIERVQCRVREDPKCLLELNVNGQCVDRPPVTESLKFKTNVRKSTSQQIKISNPTGSTWNLKPQIDNASWVIRPSNIECKAQETVTFDVSYEPIVTTDNLPDKEPEKGMLFIPLPTGEARLYNLEGQADPPLPAGVIEREVQCKTMHMEKIVVTNWLKKPQKFKVTRSFQMEPGIIIKGLDDIDIPPQASRDYKFTFMSYKDARLQGTVTFTNEETNEYLFYNCTFKTLPAATVDTITLRTPVRQKSMHDITIENPLQDKPITLVTKCDNPDITVPASLVVPPQGEGKLSIIYFPLVIRPGETIAKLNLSCPELGDFPYVLKLYTSQAGLEKHIRFQCPLGSSQTQTMRFVHFAKVATDFNCKFIDPKPSIFYKTNGQMQIKCTPAPTEGAEVTFDVTYEPAKIGDVSETLQVSSTVGGDYTFSMSGTCLPPERQGPVDIKANGSAQVNFKNVFADNVTFNLHCDHPAFQVSKASELIPAKKPVTFAVTFKPLDEVYPVRGKLIISCLSPGETPERKVEWVYYLRGLKADSK
mmetsp:Transcript_118563/g.206475  ORF Transcript_118563/g.206475 Transcript_118563/m.206475 type:complete len:3749 (+) Transcript_118563:362-11608(+)